MPYRRTARDLLASVDLPPPTISKLSFCNSNKAAKVASWADKLKATQITQTSVMLYKALPEVCQLKTDGANRLAILEALRAITQNVIEGLTQEFLNVPLSTSENTQKMAIVAQALQKSMIDGYTLCAKELAAQKRINQTSQNTLTQAIHRALTGIGLLFLRSYQLYTQLPAGLWLRAHTLFQIAESFDLISHPITDNMLVYSRATNIQCAYSRIVMMGTAKLNQVTRNEVPHVYEAFETWSLYIRLLPEPDTEKENFYVVNLSKDFGPQYQSRVEANETDRVIGLNFQKLLSFLNKQSTDSEEIIESSGAVTTPHNISNTLLDHIINCWSGISLRQQERKNVTGTAEVCVGLVECHKNVSGGIQFDEFSSAGELDSGSLENTIMSGFTPAENTPSVRKAKNQIYRVSIQNVSAGGYCLHWRGDIPSRLQAGEIIGIRPMGKRIWTLGVVRWLRQLKQSSQLGIQILSENAIAAGAAQLYDMGGYSDYMRAFIINPKRGSNAAISIITASAPFKEYDKVKLFDGENVTTIKLDKCFFATANIKQFAYRPLEGSKPSAEPKNTNRIVASKGKSSFDDSWE